MDVMLDLETMGNGPDAAIVAVGAIEFDATAGTLGRTFYRGVNLETSVRGGGKIDASTVMWWLRQNDEARKGICGDVKMERTGTHHNAIDDATTQARHALALLAANAELSRGGTDHD